jgi:elongator complex protein 3
VQSLNDQVLKLNNRGHDVAATRQAFKLLRQAGFKIHAHWMANLHGSSPDEDITDFAKLFSDPDFHPDELKIYPCSLIGSAELMAYHQRGEWQPYTKEELLKVVSSCLTVTPAYCRLTRVIRDIPSTDIVTGNKLTNFRQLAESAVNQDGQADELKDIRSREIRNQTFDASQIHQEIIWYDTSVSREAFIQWLVPVADQGKKVEKILGFLRLSLPLQPEEPIFEELKGAAMVRELHIYGQAVNLGHQAGEAAQHLGLGKKLLATAAELCREAGFEKLAVISAIGTKAYYRKQGFTDGDLYQFMSLPN